MTTSRAVVQVALTGEVELATIHAARERLAAAMSANPGAILRVDMSAVTFLDSTGIGMLVGMNRRAAEAGGALEIANPHERVAYVLTLTGLDRVLGYADPPSAAELIRGAGGTVVERPIPD